MPFWNILLPLLIYKLSNSIITAKGGFDMLKNTKFLYCIIAVLLTVCILCGIHIIKDFSMMYESREHLLNSFAIDASELVAWSGELLNSENDKATFDIAFSQVKMNLSEVYGHFNYFKPPYGLYNIFLKEKQYQYYAVFGYSFEGYYTDIVLMEKRYEESGKLSEEDLLYIKTLHDSMEYMLSKLLDENSNTEYLLNVKKEYIKNDDLFSILYQELDEKMKEVAIR